MANVANGFSEPISNSIKQTNNIQPQVKLGQKKRGRSLTRQVAVKSSGGTEVQELDRINGSPNSQGEKSMFIKSNKQAKSSPTKTTLRKPEDAHTSHQSPSTPKTPNHEDVKRQTLTKYNENKNGRLSSRNSSNNASLQSSREQTPKVPTPLSPREIKQGNHRNILW